MGNYINVFVTFKSWIRWIIYDNDSQYSSVAYISISVELWAVIVCRFEDQYKCSPSNIMNPDSDLDLNDSSKTLNECSLGIDASWRPQLTSVKEEI